MGRENNTGDHRSMNAPVMVELEGETDPLVIAMKVSRCRKAPAWGSCLPWPLAAAVKR